MKTKTLIIFLFLPILSFAQNLELNYQKRKIRKEIRKIVAKIAKGNEIHSECIGYSCKITSQYKHFERLIKKANLEELVELTKHPQPVVRGYAFWGLAKKHYEDLAEIFVAHANDEELVFQMDGCTGGDMPLIDFMTWVVTPRMIDVNCKKLNPVAFAKMNANRLKLQEKED